MNGVIENYESLSAITTRMREAAEQGSWDTLVELEKQCSQQAQIMKTADSVATLDETDRKRKVALIRKILADDAAIRDHTEPWMAQLQRIMQNSKTEQRLRQAYAGDRL
jgi:flagellar protein FliT